MTTYAEPRQLALLDDPLDVRFTEFHHTNPHVYRALVDYARRWKAAGHDACSMKMLFELLRWHDGITTTGEAVLLNNSYTSRYARLIAANEPDLVGFFHTRTLHTDGNYS
ncbi:MAG: hypothetical protein ACKOAF_04975 [Actinomycetes bacterium]